MELLRLASSRPASSACRSSYGRLRRGSSALLFLPRSVFMYMSVTSAEDDAGPRAAAAPGGGQPAAVAAATGAAPHHARLPRSLGAVLRPFHPAVLRALRWRGLRRRRPASRAVGAVEAWSGSRDMQTQVPSF